MSSFPRTEVGGVSLSRLVIGTNWFLGYTHQTKSRTRMIQDRHSAQTIADIVEVYVQDGVNVAMGPLSPLLDEGLALAEQKTGQKVHRILTPGFGWNAGGPDWDAAAKAFDQAAAAKATFCWPHQTVVDNLYDGITHTIRHMDRLSRMIRERGMIPGLSTHRPECILSADQHELDVASYVCIYNAAGFLMPVEVDWMQNIIHNAAKPVTTIKAMAAGRLMPYVGLPFAWATLRDCDLVTVGTTTPDEARECLEISHATLERRHSKVELQVTRSKQNLMSKFTQP